MNSQNNPNHKPLTAAHKGDRLLNQKADAIKRQKIERERYLAARRRIKADIARIHAEYDMKCELEREETERKHAEALAEIEARRAAAVTREQLLESGAIDSRAHSDEDKLRIAGLSIDENKRLSYEQEHLLEQQAREAEDAFWRGEQAEGGVRNHLTDLELKALTTR